MSSDHVDENLDPRMDELLRLACDDSGLARPSDDLRERLDADARLCDDFAQTRALVRELRDVLAPEPLSAELKAEIGRRFDELAGERQRLMLRPYRVAGLVAAAAALVLAVLGPLNEGTDTRQPAPAIALSEDDAADIAEALALLTWDGPVDYSLERVSADVSDLDERIERRAEAGSGLPWGADDDWDLPRDERGTGQTTPATADEICRGAPSIAGAA